MIDVLFIVGTGRSGSTILERLLATHAGTLSLGELRFVWDRGFVDDQLCSCRQPFSRCPYWVQVARILDDRFTSEGVRRIPDLRRRVDRNRYIPSLHHPLLGTRRYRRQTEDLIDVLSTLYAAASDVGEGRLIIDSTKDPTYAHLLALVPGIRLAFVHLVRDPRAVAWSWQRKKHRPEVHWTPTEIERWPWWRVAFEWDIRSLLSLWLLRRERDRSITMRYEQFAANPDGALADIGDLLARQGMQSLGERLSHPDAERYHSVAGNPLRFEPLRAVQIVEDTEWKRSQPRHHGFGVSLVTLPVRALYALAEARGAKRSNESGV